MFRFVLFLSISFFSFNLNPDYLEWSTTPLKFSDFKGTPPKNSASPVNLSTMISFQSRQVQGMPPEMTIYNRMDRDASWINSKKEEILQIQQIHFNTSELYARKIRKEMKRMNDAKVIEKDKYSEAVKKYTSTLHKIQKSKKVLLEDQPNLIKLWDKQIKDSLNLFKDYAK
ncbi:BAR domain-containing protein [Moheibacter sediminis]|uniref:Uncharacterized protein n=1 Tax=Moheibacter sediminis TaxID=1434700 RepID=A0A1W1ZN29_9FLAO|nr:hypothetical protein [Moheibacter sediminis]SMC49960.1 hypothetical protein SAMN06296427_103115 [Moheibacter sediminis]